MPLAHGTPVWNRSQPSPVTRGIGGLCAPGSQKLHGFNHGAPLRRAVRPVHALTAPSLPSVNPAPSLTHVMLRNSLPLHAGFIGKATPAGLRPSVIPPHLRPLSSTGIAPRLQSYGPLRHPAGPAYPSRGSGCRVHGTVRASRVAATFHLPHVPTPLPRRKPAGALVARFPSGQRPSPTSGRVGFRICGFRGLLSVHCTFRPARSLNRLPT